MTEKIGIFCPISENMKSLGQDLNCHNSKKGCHTKLMEIPGSGVKVSPDFDCLYGTCKITFSKCENFYFIFYIYRDFFGILQNCQYFGWDYISLEYSWNIPYRKDSWNLETLLHLTQEFPGVLFDTLISTCDSLSPDPRTSYLLKRDIINPFFSKIIKQFQYVRV